MLLNQATFRKIGGLILLHFGSKHSTNRYKIPGLSLRPMIVSRNACAILCETGPPCARWLRFWETCSFIICLRIASNTGISVPERVAMAQHKDQFSLAV